MTKGLRMLFLIQLFASQIISFVCILITTEQSKGAQAGIHASV